SSDSPIKAPAPNSTYTLSLHDALPIFGRRQRPRLRARGHRGGQHRADEADGADDEGQITGDAGDRQGDLPHGGGGHVDGGVDRKDRKSTRLNSSHVKNSYAVFSLKKKI